MGARLEFMESWNGWGFECTEAGENAEEGVGSAAAGVVLGGGGAFAGLGVGEGGVVLVRIFLHHAVAMLVIGERRRGRGV